MTTRPVAVHRAGLVTSVGLTAPASCAAIRAKVANPAETRCSDSTGEWITAHQVLLGRPWRGLAKLAKMAAMAIEECLTPIPREDWTRFPVLLCTAERDRPGRIEGIDDQLTTSVADEIDVRFGQDTGLICQGRTGVAVALKRAQDLIYQRNAGPVLVVVTDSLVTRRTLAHYDGADRLLTSSNSNGFIAGEGACAFLVGKPTGRPELICTGFGFDVETAHIDSGEPLRGDGLTRAHKAALAESGRQMDDVDYRITDLTGEHYYFKEANFAFGRLLRNPKGDSELWHPAECTGAAGASLAGVCLAVAHAAVVRGYAPGPTALLHFSDDAGQRASVVCSEG
jgi:3-oxoacyl-[acyl-carrier-protein] synthase-1